MSERSAVILLTLLFAAEHAAWLVRHLQRGETAAASFEVMCLLVCAVVALSVTCSDTGVSP